MSASQEVGEIFGQGSGPATALLRSPTVIIAGIGLWGMNIYFFRAFGIDYKRTFLESSSIKEKPEESEDNMSQIELQQLLYEETPTSSSNHNMESTATAAAAKQQAEVFTAPRLLGLSLVLLIMLHVTSFTWIHILGGDAMGAVFCFYLFVAIGALYSTWARQGLFLILGRVMELLHPRCYCCSYERYRPIPFVDVFFADALCSLSKVFFDWGMLWHMASHYPEPVPASAHSIIIPSVCAALPYIIRARQCMVMHTIGVFKNDPKRYLHVLNAIKYCSSLFPICLSAYQKTVVTAEQPTKAAALEAILIVLLLINCCYCFLWDVIMDWGMISDPISLISDPKKYILKEPNLCFQKFLRPRLRFGPKITVAILITNLFLRFTWLLRFWEKRLFPSVDEFVLCTEFLEVFRRALWNLLRVEWEQIKITSNKEQQHTPIKVSLSMEEDDDYFPNESSNNSNSNTNSGNSITGGSTIYPLLPSRRTLSLPTVS